MKSATQLLVRLYACLLRLYPRRFRTSFEHEMVADFAELAADAASGGFLPLLRFMLREGRDLPLNALRLHIKEVQMSQASLATTLRAAARAAIAFGLAFAALMTVESLFVSAMNGRGWLLLLRLAHSLDILLNYNAAAQTILYSLGLGLGALAAGAVLALVYSDLRHIRRYWLAALACWAAPLVLLRSAGVFFRPDLGDRFGQVFLIAAQLVIGLGFAFLFLWILKPGSRTAWLLAGGVLAFYAASMLVRLLLPFLPLSDPYVMGWSWTDLAVSTGLMCLEGGLTGAVLGAISGSSQQKGIQPAAA